MPRGGDPDRHGDGRLRADGGERRAPRRHPARELSRILNGSEMDGMRDPASRRRCGARSSSPASLRNTSCARVGAPADGHVVAVTGDGVNDAPR